jgi:hypothetical protein
MLNVVFIVTALLVSAAPAMAGVTLTFYEGADCTGSIIAVSTGSSAGECTFLTDGGSGAQSVPDSINFFELSGSHEICSNAATFVLGGGLDVELRLLGKLLSEH